MDSILKLVEDKIAEAMKNGEFENLPGRGKPLDLEDDAHVPVELRMAYRILKQANIPPEEVLMHKSSNQLRERLLADAHLTEADRQKLKRQLRQMDMELNMKLEQFRKQYGGL